MPIVQESQHISQLGPELKKMSVILLIFLMVITFGIYYPVWFLTRRSGINNLQSKEKLGSGVFVFAIVVFSINLVFAFVSGVIEGLGEIYAFSGILAFVAGIILLAQCFEVRRIFNEHYNEHLQRGISFSVGAIFFFQIYYLQYKINRF